MLLERCRTYWIRRQIKALLSLPALQLPEAYVRLHKRYGIVLDRGKYVSAYTAEVGKYLDWVNDQLSTINYSTNEKPLLEGGNTTIRIDKFLYDRTKGHYVTFDEIMGELSSAYTIFNTVLSDRNHSKHYYVKDKVLRHVDAMHHTLVAIVKSI